MGNIILIAPSDEIAGYGHQLKQSMPEGNCLTVITANMEASVPALKSAIETQEIDVVISRGTTGRIVSAAYPELPFVNIPIAPDDMLYFISEAKKLTGKEYPHLGFLDFGDFISDMIPFLRAMKLKISSYSFSNTEMIRKSINQARTDRCDILICGKICYLEALKMSFPAVLLTSSLTAVQSAFRQALTIQKAILAEHKKTDFLNTIFNAVSEAIISISRDLIIEQVNGKTEAIFGLPVSHILGKPVQQFFNEFEAETLRSVSVTGEDIIGEVWIYKNRQYAVRIVPIRRDQAIQGLLLTMNEVQELQAMEQSVRLNLQKKGNHAKYTFSDIKGSSEAIRDAVNIAHRFAPMRSNVLIIGETGTGKELFAQSIHNASMEQSGPFVAVNCGAIPEELVESELFGYTAGSFTGAQKGGKAGLFELAHNGTIFLDEISEMPLSSQVKLLRVIQERQVRRVGSDTVIPINVRIIAACNVNLLDKVRQGAFRQDLYYRLSILVIHLPPLRNRAGDISALASIFLEQYCRQFYKNCILSPAACRKLESYHWEGNIRQLRNFCERLAAVSNQSIIDAAFIQEQYQNVFEFSPNPLPPDTLTAPAQSLSKENDTFSSTPDPVPLSSDTGISGTLSEPPDSVSAPQKHESATSQEIIRIHGISYTKEGLYQMLLECNYKKSRMAQQLGISRTSLWKYLKIMGLS